MSMTKNCAGITRRDSLKLGLGGLFGAGLVDLLRLRGRADEPSLDAKAKSCILIWLDGGPTHYETFDPKPNAPAEIRGEFGVLRANLPNARDCHKSCAPIWMLHPS